MGLTKHPDKPKGECVMAVSYTHLLQTANAHGLVLDAAGALALALALLGADTAADGGQGRGAGNDLDVYKRQ